MGLAGLLAQGRPPGAPPRRIRGLAVALPSGAGPAALAVLARHAIAPAPRGAPPMQAFLLLDTGPAGDALALIPSARPWEPVRVMAVSGGPAGPTRADIVATLESWRGRFGADLLGACPASVRLRFDRPPETDAEMEAFAAEAAAFAPRMTDDAGATLRPAALASILRRGDPFNLRWD